MHLQWKAVLLTIALFMLVSFGAYAAEEEPVPYPEALQIVVTREEATTENGLLYQNVIYDTALDSVDEELRLLQQELLGELIQHADPAHNLQLEGTYRISGTKWCGFLLMGRATCPVDNPDLSYETENTTYLCYRMVTYDMETGEKLTLKDVFPQESPAWEKIADSVRTSMLAVYPHLAKDPEKLQSYAAALADKSFLPSAGRLMLCAPLWPLHEDHWQMVNTFLPYPDYRQWMNEEAAAQTDNSNRPIIAITYDDGPVRVQSERVLNALADNGAGGTFFCIGRNVEMWPDIVRQELDYGHTVGSHTYKHKYDFQVSADYIRDDRDQCKQIHSELTGIAPVLFRAPGGNTDKYLREKIGWPIILWRFSAGDTGQNNAYKIADRIYGSARDGDIILMHDIYKKTAHGSEMFLSRLAADGFLFATVDELLYLHGITPQPDTIYYDAFTPPVTTP